MADRKRVSPIQSRDHGFIARVEAKGEKHAASFGLAPLPIAEREAISNTEQSETAGIAPVEAPAAVKAGRRGERVKAAALPRKAEPSRKVSIYVGVPDDLLIRTKVWATAAKCPPRKIALAALNEMRADLITRLQSVDLLEVQSDGNQKIGERVNTSILLSASLLDELEEKYNPHGFNSIPAMISGWIRSEFNEYFDRYLSKAGY